MKLILLPSWTRFLFVATVAICRLAAAQDITIKRIELEHDRVFLYYDLQDTTRGKYYTVNLYSSRDNFINPLEKLKGDVGLEIPPGNNRHIEVHVKEQFGDAFEAKLAFELRAKVYIPFIRLEGFNDFRKFKRGVSYEIHWTGGRPQNVLTFELYEGDKKVNAFTNIANAGKYNLIFPMDTKPGKHYRFKVSDSKNKDEVVNTGDFTISRKIPLMLKTIPVMLTGGALFFLLQPTPECEGCLVDFPGTPNN